MASQEPISVSLPAEQTTVANFTQEDKPGMTVINQALVDHPVQQVFIWHLSILIACDDMIVDGIPSAAELEILEPWEKRLDSLIKSEVNGKPNAVFLAQTTWNGSRELVYRVFQPETVNDQLWDLIEREDYPRPFEFTLDCDQEWEQARWYLDAVRTGAQ